MSKIEVNKCDACGAEERSDVRRVVPLNLQPVHIEIPGNKFEVDENHMIEACPDCRHSLRRLIDGWIGREAPAIEDPLKEN